MMPSTMPPENRRHIRQQLSDEAGCPAGGTRNGLRHTDRPSVELYIRLPSRLPGTSRSCDSALIRPLAESNSDIAIFISDIRASHDLRCRFILHSQSPIHEVPAMVIRFVTLGHWHGATIDRTPDRSPDLLCQQSYHASPSVACIASRGRSASATRSHA